MILLLIGISIGGTFKRVWTTYCSWKALLVASNIKFSLFHHLTSSWIHVLDFFVSMFNDRDVFFGFWSFFFYFTSTLLMRSIHFSNESGYFLVWHIFKSCYCEKSCLRILLSECFSFIIMLLQNWKVFTFSFIKT